MLGCVVVNSVVAPWYESLTAGELVLTLIAVPMFFESMFAFLEELLIVRVRVD